MYNKFNILSSKKRKKNIAIEDAFSDFITSRKAMNVTQQTIRSYNGTLKPFISFCKNLGVTKLNDVDSFLVDAYFADMADKGHSDGGMHSYYRSLRSFMRWAWSVYNFDGICPTDISKVKAPPANPIPGIPEAAVRDMLIEAEKTEYPMRDVAFLMFLVDSGVRKQEAANIKIKDVDPTTGDVFVEYGKGRKNRTVHIGNKTRKAIIKYLKTVENDRPDDFLWVSRDGYPLSPDGLVEIIRRIQKNLNISPMYSMHDFRRYCALTMYRASHNLLLVSLYLGHASVDVTRRYLDINKDDMHDFGETYSIIDKMSRERPKKTNNR